MGRDSTTTMSWQRWWSQPVPVERVAVFGSLITGFALISVTLFSHYVLRYSEVALPFFEPVILLQLPSLLGMSFQPVPSRGLHTTIDAVMVLALLTSFLGYRNRIALRVSAHLPPASGPVQLVGQGEPWEDPSCRLAAGAHGRPRRMPLRGGCTTASATESTGSCRDARSLRRLGASDRRRRDRCGVPTLRYCQDD